MAGAAGANVSKAQNSEPAESAMTRVTLTERYPLEIWKEACREWLLIHPAPTVPFGLPKGRFATGFVRGVYSVEDLFPESQWEFVFPLEGSIEGSIGRDWYMVGRDLFKAITDQNVTDRVRVNPNQPEHASTPVR